MVPYKTIICRRWKNEDHCDHPNCLYTHGKNELRRNDGIGHLTNYGQKAYFWTFWTFSHRDKSRPNLSWWAAKSLKIDFRILKIPKNKILISFFKIEIFFENRINNKNQNKNSIFRLLAACRVN